MPTPIDNYLANVPAGYKTLLEDLRETILEVIPGAEELITYQIPTFKFQGKAVVGFAAFKKHCSFLAFSGSLLSQFKDLLTGFDQTKSSLHFTPDNPIPKELVKEMVKARLLANHKKLK